MCAVPSLSSSAARGRIGKGSEKGHKDVQRCGLFLTKKQKFGVYCFRVLSLEKKLLRRTMIEVHKQMTPCRGRHTASGRQLRKGIWGWLSRKGIVPLIKKEAIWLTKVCGER